MRGQAQLSGGLTGRYGVGYHMVMEKAPSSTSEKVEEVVSLMESHVQGAKCVLDAGAELAFILPAEETRAFPSLFQDLEGIYTLYHIYKATYSHTTVVHGSQISKSLN